MPRGCGLVVLKRENISCTDGLMVTLFARFGETLTTTNWKRQRRAWLRSPESRCRRGSCYLTSQVSPARRSFARSP